MIVTGELVVRIERDLDLPLHFEASPLRTPVKVAGWPIAILATVGGIALFVRAETAAAEAPAVLLVVVGCALVVLLIRCRSYQVVVGERMNELRLGPFRRTLPSGCVEGASARLSSSWRRLYAPREVVLTLSVETRPVIVPTHEPEELRAVLTE
jgi:hypothetical protein